MCAIEDFKAVARVIKNYLLHCICLQFRWLIHDNVSIPWIIERLHA